MDLALKPTPNLYAYEGRRHHTVKTLEIYISEIFWMFWGTARVRGVRQCTSCCSHKDRTLGAELSVCMGAPQIEMSRARNLPHAIGTGKLEGCVRGGFIQAERQLHHAALHAGQRGQATAAEVGG